MPVAPPKKAATAPARPPVVDRLPQVNPEGEFLWTSSPSRYIARMSSVTGREVLRPIDPDELLIQAHRDKNPLEVTAQFLASRLIQVTGNEDAVRDAMKKINELGTRMAGRLGKVTGSKTVERGARQAIGVVDREFFFQFREPTRLSEREVKARIVKLQEDARAALAARGRTPKLRVLLTGATGFLGQEILAQAAPDRRIAEVVSVIRPQKVRDPKTKEVVRVLSPTDRGLLLLSRLGIVGRAAKKFRFVDGDIEKPFLGIGDSDLATIEKTITHVVHCAASVSFDDTYENSFRANVGGCKNALAFSLRLQRAKGSKFVLHVAIETSYIHGRKKRSMAVESALVFPKNFYNNFYELTKAMASMETDQHMVVDGLRVIQLLPAIVIGDSRTGNNRGDTKVVNAPVNAFGRAKEALDALKSTPFGESKAAAISSVAMVFPADRSAELNLVTVDRVVEGILASLTRPEAIGERVHLATDNRIRTEEIIQIEKEELGVDVRLTDPTLFRNVTLPLLTTILKKVNEPKLANALEKLGTIFGGYGEWGQPIHSVGNDVRVLGLPLRRPNTRYAFRMLCRHNKLVQEFGKVKDADEVARRERIWADALERIEKESGRQAASLEADEFRRRIGEILDLKAFVLK
ncbi:MAG: SDR family oxidoreductase [Holophagales bacterium]|nr:SDR family oxidoreductase [Holophagales bacterium]